MTEGADSSFFLRKELEEGCLNGIGGEYSTSEVYLVDEAAAEEFDKSFPTKEKLRLSSQTF